MRRGTTFLLRRGRKPEEAASGFLSMFVAVMVHSCLALRQMCGFVQKGSRAHTDVIKVSLIAVHEGKPSARSGKRKELEFFFCAAFNSIKDKCECNSSKQTEREKFIHE